MKGYVNALGQSMKTFEITKDMSKHEFSIFLETEPDEEEKFMLEQNIQASIASKELRIEDAIAIRALKNVKIANRMLVFRRKKYQQEQMMMAQQQMQQQAQAEQQKLAMQSQMEAQKLQMETQSKAQLESAKIQMESDKMQKEYKLKSELARQQFEYDFALTKLKEEVSGKMNSANEDRKDERIKKQAIEQSKLLSQKMGERGEIKSEEEEKAEQVPPLPDMYNPPPGA
jgi:hypothetical protein